MNKKQYTYKEATPEQIKEWQEGELKWWGDNALKFVVYASIPVSYTHLTLPTNREV